MDALIHLVWWLIYIAKNVRIRYLSWLHSGAPDGVVEVVAYDLAAFRKRTVFRLTLLGRLWDAVTGRRDVAHALARVVESAEEDKLYAAALARRNQKIYVIGRSLSETVARQADARGALAQYKIATVAARVDLTATYNKFIRSLRTDDALGLRPHEIIAVAYLDGELRPRDLMRCIAADRPRLCVTTLETLAVRNFDHHDIVVDV